MINVKNNYILTTVVIRLNYQKNYFNYSYLTAKVKKLKQC